MIEFCFVFFVSACVVSVFFFFSSRRRHTRFSRDWSSEVCSSDLIAAIGDLHCEPAGSNLHASGKVVAPGFIDMHSHSDWRLWENRRAESKVRQGVTTEVVGNCGFSPAPVSDEFL